MATSGNDKYAITSSQGVIARLGEILTDINLRLVQAESRYDTTDRAAQEVANQGLRYLETVIVPAATKVADLLLSLSDLFETTSKSSVKISDPLVTFQVDPKDSNTFATLGYVIASAAGSTSGLGGPVVSFDHKSGVLVVDPDYTWGSGTFSDWKLIGSPPVGAIVAATDPVLASRAQAIGHTIAADATAKIAAAQALVQTVANSRVPLDGSQPMTGGLTVPSIVLGSTGDLKTYVDKGVRTDLAQAFTPTQKRQARINIGAGGFSGGISGTKSLLSSEANSFRYLFGDGYTVNLPNVSGLVNGDYFEFSNTQGGTITIARSATDNSLIYYGIGAAQSNIRLGPAQTVRLTFDGASAWIASSRAISPERAVSVDPQTFSAADIAQALANIGAQAALGFSPVQQGGGPSQSGNKLNLGWGGALNAIFAAVDGASIGKVWTDHIAQSSLATSGYQKLPSGLIVQWGFGTNAAADYTVILPITYPNATLAAFACQSGAVGGDGLLATSTDNVAAGSIGIRRRIAYNGGSIAGAFAYTFWLTLGF